MRACHVRMVRLPYMLLSAGECAERILNAVLGSNLLHEAVAEHARLLAQDLSRNTIRE